ncbi:hypothetical protein GcC1_149002, partial [Golovinomyces cichoracearum]
MLQPRRQSPQKENQTAQNYSTTLSTPSPTPYSPPHLSHKKLHPKILNAMGSENIVSIIQKRLATANAISTPPRTTAHRGM